MCLKHRVDISRMQIIAFAGKDKLSSLLYKSIEKMNNMIIYTSWCDVSWKCYWLTITIQL